MSERKDPIRPTDDEARGIAQGLIAGAQTAVLGVIHPVSGGPYVSRIAIGRAPGGGLMTLISSLTLHWKALAADPRASLLIGEPGAKGDPLNHARLSVFATAAFVAAGAAERPALRDAWLAHYPKAKLYVDFADFAFVRFQCSGALLNGGFGKAYELAPEDLRLNA